LLLDADLKAQFLNRKIRDYFGVTTEQVAAHPSYLELIANAPHASAHGVPPEKMQEFFSSRVDADDRHRSFQVRQRPLRACGRR
jgi:hypothetical protein